MLLESNHLCVSQQKGKSTKLEHLITHINIFFFKMSIFIDTPAFNSISPNFNSLTTYSFHPNSMVCYSVTLVTIMQWRLLSLFRKIHFSILERKKHVVVKRGNKLLFRVTVGVKIIQKNFSPMIILYNMIFTGLQTVRIS